MENKAPADIVILIVVGCAGMLMLVGFIIMFVLYYQKKVLAQKNQLQVAENKYQRELLSAAIQIEEKERERIAKNVHDDVGIILSAIKMNLNKMERNADKVELTKSLSGENLRLLEDSMQNIRNISKDLKPSSILKLGFASALYDLCLMLGKSGIIINFDQKDWPIRMPEQKELQLYRLTKELLNNIIKHSGAGEITVQLKPSGAFYDLVVLHNGRGINSKEAIELSKEQRGLGLKSIQSRAQLINASVTYNAPENAKASIEVKILS